PALWRKHFGEDLVEAMARMGHETGATVTLGVRKLDTGAAIDLTNVPMSADNRRLVLGLPDDPTGGTVRLFSAVRWNGDAPEVQVNWVDTWYALDGVDDRTTAQIIAFAQQSDAEHWRQRFSDRSVELLNAMGDQPVDGRLDLRTLDTKETVTINKNVFDPVGTTAAKPGAVAAAGRADGTGYARLSPFAAVRWRDGANYEVKVNGAWYALVSLDGQPIGQLIDFSKSRFGSIWQK